MSDGAGAAFVVSATLDGERLDRAVALLADVTRAVAGDLVDGGGVRVGATVATSRSRRVREGEVLHVDLPPSVEIDPCPPDPSVEVPVVHADEDVIVVDKPAALVVHPGAGHVTGTVAQGLLARFPELRAVGDPARPGVVHRLDRGTSGLLVVARTPRAHASLTAQLAARSVERRYLALVWGRPEAAAGIVDAPIGRAERDRTRMAVSAAGRAARTRYETRRTWDHPTPVALLECRLETGRTHQIRVHLAAIGHPVVGDVRYRGGRPAIVLDRPFLHATSLAFEHPGTGERVTFSSPLPRELQAVLDDLGAGTPASGDDLGGRPRGTT